MQRSGCHQFLRSCAGVLGLLSAVMLFACANAQVVDRDENGSPNWPFVRGPAFDGHSRESQLADSWGERGPPVLWSRNLGQGYSAFVGSGNVVFTQAQNVTGQYVFCLNADTGETIWQYRYDWPYEAAGVYPGPRSTPTIADGRVYFTSPDGLVACLAESNGTLLWSVELNDRYEIRGCDFGYACSPTVIDGMVILPVGGPSAGMVALDAQDGSEVWRSQDEEASYTPAFPIEFDGEPLVVGYLQNALVVLHRTTGKLHSKLKLSTGYDEHSAWPIYHEPYLWISGPFQSGSQLLRVTASSLEPVWASPLLSNDVCSSVLADGHLYGFDILEAQSKTHRPSRGIFRCLEFETGMEKWSNGSGRPRRSNNADEFLNDIGQSGIIAADGKLLILNELGDLILLKIQADRCHELDRCSVLAGELTWTAPCLHSGRVYIRNHTQAMCVFVGRPENLATEMLARAGDMPQRSYHNIATMILAVEPDYAFDVPGTRWLINWYVAGMAILISVSVLSYLTFPSKQTTLTQLLRFLLLFAVGAAGTTALGRISGEFLFTWPVCLYAAMEFATVRPEASAVSNRFVKYCVQRLPLFGLIAVSFTYFAVCRRLSLVFEWTFLVGYLGAIPCVWLRSRIHGSTGWSRVGQLILSILGFTAFYGTAVAFLKMRF